MRTLTVIIALTVFVMTGLAQPFADTLWTETYGVWASKDMVKTSSGDFVIVGFDTSTVDQDNMFLLKVDDDGDSLWIKYFDGYSDDDEANAVALASNGFILGGYADGDNGNKRDMFVVRTDNNGNEVWSSFFGTDTTHETVEDIILTSDGNYAVVGTTDPSSISGGTPYLLKVDDNGDTLWTRKYSHLQSGVSSTVIQTSDGNYILSGYTDGMGAGGSDVFLLKVDDDGDVIWTRTYGTSLDDHGHHAVETSDGGFLIVGDRDVGGSDYSGYIVRTDSDGDTLWTRTYGGEDSDYLTDIAIDSDSTYCICGKYSLSDAGYDYATWVMKFNDNGDSLWTYLNYVLGIEEKGLAIEKTGTNSCAVMSWAQAGSDPFVKMAEFVGPSLDPVDDLTVYRIGTDNSVVLRWDSVAYADEYIIYSCEDFSGSRYDSLTTVSDTTYTTDTLYSRRFYYVRPFDSETWATDDGGYNFAGYVNKVITGTPGGTAYTAFGLPFKFWDVSSDIPVFGTESTRPSDICGSQTNAGDPTTADKISQQGTGVFALRLTGGNWAGSLESTEAMTPGYAYYYQNKSGSNRNFVLAGEVDNSGDYGTIAITPYGATALSWREARDHPVSALNLLEDGFTGGALPTSSDKLSEQITGSFVVYITTTSQWTGGLTNITPGRAYYIYDHNGVMTSYSYDGD